MSSLKFEKEVDEICEKDSRYPVESYYFIREGLDHTLKFLKRNSSGASGHVSGRELLEGIRDFTLKEFGPMSKSVLDEWGIKTCEDFGQIVFNLVNKGVLGKTPTDSPNDFKEGFNFEDAFVKPFQPKIRRGLSTPELSLKKTPPRKRNRSKSES